MKKILLTIALFLSLSLSAHAISYLDGEYYGFCPLVNPYNSSAVTAVGFFAYGYDSNGDLVYIISHSSGYYSIRTFIVGYTSGNSVSGTFNGKPVGTDTDFIICPNDYLYDGVGALAYGSLHFYAGRAHNWLIPKSYLQSGKNVLTVNLEGLIRTINLTVQ